MTFNAVKCKVFCFNSNESETLLGLNDISIPSVSSIKDLGITISQNLRWDNHLKLKFIAVNEFFHFFSNVLLVSTSHCGPSLTNINFA